MAVLRKTKTVESLMDYFNKSKDPISILELVDKFDGTMDKSTVYRILERLEDSNILHSFLGSDGLKRYAKFEDTDDSSKEKEMHPHFVCNYCGNSSCLPIKISIPNIPNYIIESTDHLLTGRCKDCIS
tara:strand:- start:2 stop:385 length:384 start_codon:yes stop_codon:yes gene_type:complete